jgi:chromosomal replication initiator protein
LHAHEELEPIWHEIREELRREAPDFQFHIWLEPLELAGIDGRTLLVRAPEHIRTWVEERYLSLLRRAAERCFDSRATVHVVGEGWEPPLPGGTRSLEPTAEPGLSPKYTFEQFVIGSGNRFAHAAALAVAELPGQAYNPLFIHGRPGLGKTHLLHAIGHYVNRFSKDLRVRYATVEEFTSAFVDALRNRRIADFKDRFRKADVVLIDDVQFLASKKQTREEFFHTFNALCEADRQLVMTSDCPPQEVPDLEQRLAERLQSGLVVELELPGIEVRRAILEKRARLDDVALSRDVCEEIARSVSSSVRALEGALIRVVAYASLRGEPPTPTLVRHVLGRLGANSHAATTVADILELTAEKFGVRREDLLERNRRPDIAIARQVAMYLARELTRHSLPEIGRRVGGRNHATVLHAVNRISVALQRDEGINQAVSELRTRLEDAR